MIFINPTLAGIVSGQGFFQVAVIPVQQPSHVAPRSFNGLLMVVRVVNVETSSITGHQLHQAGSPFLGGICVP